MTSFLNGNKVFLFSPFMPMSQKLLQSCGGGISPWSCAWGHPPGWDVHSLFSGCLQLVLDSASAFLPLVAILSLSRLGCILLCSSEVLSMVQLSLHLPVVLKLPFNLGPSLRSGMERAAVPALGQAGSFVHRWGILCHCPVWAGTGVPSGSL